LLACTLWVSARQSAWFVAIMLLGDIAMSAYVLRQLARLNPDDSMAVLLAARNAGS
jgi:hypothetical protein